MLILLRLRLLPLLSPLRSWLGRGAALLVDERAVTTLDKNGDVAYDARPLARLSRGLLLLLEGRLVVLLLVLWLLLVVLLMELRLLLLVLLLILRCCL